MPSPGKENDGDTFFLGFVILFRGVPFPDKASIFLHGVQGRVYESPYLDLPIS